jgi:hypothetical protein
MENKWKTNGKRRAEVEERHSDSLTHPKILNTLFFPGRKSKFSWCLVSPGSAIGLQHSFGI